MSTLGQLKTSSERIFSVGRDKVLTMRKDRHREALFSRLGRTCYEERSGQGDVDAWMDIDDLVAELSSLDEPGTLDEATVDNKRAAEIV